MARIAELADGTRLEFPDDTTDEVIQNTVRKMIQSQQSGVQPAAQPATAQPAEQKRGFGAELGRQIGLSVRAPLDAAANLAAIPGNAVTSAYNLATGRNVPSAGDTYRGWIDSVLPKPETPQERFSNVVASAGYSAALPASVAGTAAPTSAVGRGVQSTLTNNIGAQVAGATTGAGTTDLLSQGGVNPVLANTVGLAAGMAGGRMYQAGENAATRYMVNRDLARSPAAAGAPTEATRVQARMEAAAREAGVDLSQMSSATRKEFEQTVQQSLAQNRPLNDAEVKRWLQLQAAGVKNPTRAMVTRDPQQWAEEDRLMRLQGIGDPLRQRYDAARSAVREAVAPENPSVGQGLTGKALRNDLGAVATDLKTTASREYDRIWSSPEVREGVPITKLRQWFNTTEPRWSTQPEYKSVAEELKRLAGDRPSLTKGNYEELRQFANSLRKADGSNGGVIGAITDKIDESLLTAGKSPVFREARELWQIYKSTTNDQTIVRDLLRKTSPTDPRIGDSQVLERVMRSDPNQIKQLKNTLIVGNREGSWRTVRSMVKKDLATTLQQSDSVDSRAASFIREFDNNAERYAVIFTPDEFRSLKAAREAAVLVMQKVEGAPTNPSGTANALVEYLRKAGVAVNPMLRGVNAMLGGLPGFLIESGQNSIANQRAAAQVRSALSAGLLSPAATPPSSPILTPGLLGALYGAQQGASARQP